MTMQQFPRPVYKYRRNGTFFNDTIAIFVTYAFTFFMINLVRRVIEEKCNGSKELLKVMGMPNFVYWSSTFMNYFSVGAIVMLIFTIVLKVPLKDSVVLLENSDFFLLLIVFWLYMASLVLFCLAFTPFLNKAVLGIIVLILAYNLCFWLLCILVLQPYHTESDYFPLPLITKLCICLFPPGALMTAWELISRFEDSGEGIQWSNLYSCDTVPDMNMSRLLLSMLFACFVYSFIIWYVDAVWPWQYGVPKPFYFMFTKSYWCGYRKEKTDEFLLGRENDLKNPEVFEEEPTGISPGIVIKNLCKVFKTGLHKKFAVTDLSLNIYNNQITALLGHNGAGKTTTINILTGLYTPSDGSVAINDWDVFSQTIKARESVGICPQHNVLYGTLTVEEHLKIYASLKGVNWSKLNEETQSILSMLNLTEKKSELTENLSGGMKRKLSLGIAIIGGSKVLFLDEPTSGMDAESRRGVWDALLELRHNRTIILTTHYMEEAEVLSDRIAIMAEGEIQCCGSPMFLKRKFGAGYHMHVVKSANFNINTFTAIVSKHVPGAIVENDYEREVAFNLMSNTSISFAPLFEEIESNKEELGVNSYGITVTTMEDVFLNVANMLHARLEGKENLDVPNADETELKDVYMESSGISKSENLQNQFYGLIIKRLHYSKRHWRILISQLILPFCILCLCFFWINLLQIQSSTSYTSLKLDIEEVYGETDGFYALDSNTETYADKIKEVLQYKGVNVKQVSTLNNSILNYANSSTFRYFKYLIVSGSVERTGEKLKVTAWFNCAPYHAAPMSLLLMSTAILRSEFETGYITLTNDPLPDLNRYRIYDSYDWSRERLIAIIFVPLALSFLAASFVLVPIQERASKAKHLQLMTGISAALYWTAMFIWDFAVSIMVCIFLIVPFAVFNHNVFFGPHTEAIGAVLLLMILFVWASIPFGYLFSLIFLKRNTGFSVVCGISTLAGVILSSLFMVTKLYLKFGKMNATAKFFSWIFKFLPSYTLSSGFGNLFFAAYSNAFCESLSPKELEFNCNPNDQNYDSATLPCCKDFCGNTCWFKNKPSLFTFDKEKGVSSDILFLFFDGVLYFVLLLFFESKLMLSIGRKIAENVTRLRRKRDNPYLDETYVNDSDVLQERERVQNDYVQASHDEALLILNLSKHFRGLKAVDGLTFAIHKKECFGLLGVNGGGKTTTFRMLTGDCYPTEGTAYIERLSLITHSKEFQSHIGYCPQSDALIDKLSGREMITLFARLRGLKGQSLKRTVNALIKMIDLSNADKPSVIYSGGNKRKLSIALALIGSPPLILLDEPTAGVDPVSRQKIWKILSLTRIHTEASVILTTHSMEECKAVCNRLAIMVNGRFRCLGSIQHLKTKFGQGYTLIIKMKKEEQPILPQPMSAIKAYIDCNLKGADLKDDRQGMLLYHVVDSTLSYLFKFMEDMRTKFNLEDYTISDTSLEQIFLAFARSQRTVAENCLKF